MIWVRVASTVLPLAQVLTRDDLVPPRVRVKGLVMVQLFSALIEIRGGALNTTHPCLLTRLTDCSTRAKGLTQLLSALTLTRVELRFRRGTSLDSSLFFDQVNRLFLPGDSFISPNCSVIVDGNRSGLKRKPLLP